MTDKIPCAVLMCHAPVVVPEVGGADAETVIATRRGMEAAARAVVAHAPDVVVIVSPHARRNGTRWGITHASHLRGDFAAFGAHNLTIEVPGSPEGATLLARSAADEGLITRPIRGHGLDHGTMVPLYFLWRAGWRGATLVVAFPALPDHGGCQAMGRALAGAAARSSGSWGMVASGDGSHCLRPGAPYGYHPYGRQFDLTTRDAIAAGRYARAICVRSDQREDAAEDILDSLEVAAEAVRWESSGHTLLSYEGPFGVGYLVAVLHDSRHHGSQEAA